MKEETNLYLAAAKAQWARGDDGEIIARDLAKALMYIIKEGIDVDPAIEFIRLANE